MATTKLWHIQGRLKDLVDYVENPEKTVKPGLQDFLNVFSYTQNPNKTAGGQFVTAINCQKDIALQQMILTKQRYGKEDGYIAWHGYQSFKPGEVTPAFRSLSPPIWTRSICTIISALTPYPSRMAASTIWYAEQSTFPTASLFRCDLPTAHPQFQYYGWQDTGFAGQYRPGAGDRLATVDLPGGKSCLWAKSPADSSNRDTTGKSSLCVSGAGMLLSASPGFQAPADVPGGQTRICPGHKSGAPAPCWSSWDSTCPAG